MIFQNNYRTAQKERCRSSKSSHQQEQNISKGDIKFDEDKYIGDGVVTIYLKEDKTPQE